MHAAMLARILQPTRTMDLPPLSAWARLALLIRHIRSTRCDPGAWPAAKDALRSVLRMHSELRRPWV